MLGAGGVLVNMVANPAAATPTPAANNAVDVIVAKNPPGIKNDAPIKAAPPIMPSHPPDLAPPTMGTIVITSPSFNGALNPVEILSSVISLPAIRTRN